MDLDKPLIRSTLVSLNGCTLREFTHEYEKNVGEEPPYRRYNCPTLLDYLRKMPDVVEISQNKVGEIYLKAVESEDIRHITQMISRQKKAPAKPKRKQYSNFGTRFNNTSSKRVSYKPNYTTNIPYEPSPNMHHNKPLLPTNQSYSLHQSQPLLPTNQSYSLHRSQPLMSTNQSYSPHQSQPLLQTNQTYPLYQSQPLLQTNQSHPLYQNQPLPPTNLSYERTCRQPTDNEISNITKLLKLYPTGIWLDRFMQNYQKRFQEPLNIDFQQISNFLTKIPNVDICKQDGILQVFIKDTQNKVQKFLQQDQRQPTSACDVDATPREMTHSRREACFIKVLEAHPEGIWSRKFLAAYKETIGADLDLRSVGASYLFQLINKYPDIFSVEEYHSPTGDCLLYKKGGIKPSQFYSDLDPKEKNALVNSKKNRIQELVSTSSHGIPLKKLEDLYFENYKEELQWLQLGYNTLLDLAAEMEEDQMLSVRPSPSNGHVLIKYGPPPGRRSLTPTSPTVQQKQPPPAPQWGGGDRTKATKWPQGPESTSSWGNYLLPSKDTNEYTEDWLECYQSQAYQKSTWGLEEDQMENQKGAQLPPEDIAYTHAFEVQQLPDNLEAWQPAIISHVYSPDHLYLQLGDVYAQNFQLLEDQIQAFYDSPESEDYAIQLRFMVGQVVCIAPYGDNPVRWNRVFIQEIDDEEDKVEAFYIDYGSIETLCKNDLRFIKKEFLQLPGQAIKCQLLGIKPPTPEGWPASVTEWMLENATKDQVHVKFQPPQEKLLDKTSVVGIYDVDVGGQVSLKAEMVRHQLARHSEEPGQEADENIEDQLLGQLESSVSQSEQEYLKDCEDTFLSSLMPDKRVKRISFGEGMYPFHLVYVNFQLYMTYHEISSLFYKIKSLKKTLTMKELQLPFYLLREDKDAAIFSHMRRFHVPDVSGDRELAKTVTVYPIKSVLVMLYVMGHPQCKLIGQVLMDEYADLDSSLNYWQDPKSVEDVAKVTYTPPREDDGIQRLCLVELIGVLGALKQKRLKLLSSMLPPAPDKNHTHLALELDRLEGVLTRTLQTLRQLEKDCGEVHRYAVALFKK